MQVKREGIVIVDTNGGQVTIGAIDGADAAIARKGDIFFLGRMDQVRSLFAGSSTAGTAQDADFINRALTTLGLGASREAEIASAVEAEVRAQVARNRQAAPAEEKIPEDASLETMVQQIVSQLQNGTAEPPKTPESAEPVA